MCVTEPANINIINVHPAITFRFEFISILFYVKEIL
ncbi:hypothetical protein NVIE_1597 [Nitrososphaera viennensis EN76]|uniref:Uncharacterized protein n=1 Tax=Nitrososphaera viennensis EN76 TaxID=926571 RepID=A0A060HGT7_9ARCH|nr:hypothetical protein NVIE_1597 [Nitrososphaera viennensis EN76]